MKAIKTKYLGPTVNKGARFKATDDDGNQVTISANQPGTETELHRTAAFALCEKMGWEDAVLAGGWFRNEVYWIFVEMQKGD